MSVVQSSPMASAPLLASCSSHCPPPLVNTITGTVAFQAADDLFDVVQAECLEGFVRERAAPCVEDLHGLRTVFYLLVEVLGNGLGVDV